VTPAEWTRKAVHAGFGLCALTLRYLDWKVATGLALAALVFNVFLMPRVGRGIYRDARRLRDTGIVAYPAMVLLLILVFRGPYLPVAAAVWAMMAFGDPAAAIAGRLVGGPALPWNPEKTWVGLLAGWAVAGSASVLVFLFVSRRAPQPDSVSILMVGAGLYAFLESVRSGLDDNIVAALPTALAVYQMGMIWPPAVLTEPFPWGRVAVAAAVNAAAAIVAGSARVVRLSGAVAGGVAGFLILAVGGWPAYGVLWTFFLAGTIATKLGYRRKAASGVAQTHQGRRGVAHVVANCAVPAAALALGLPPVAFVAAFGSALADTLGTEFGALFGRKAYSPLTWRRLEPGTPGAVSVPGTAASLGGAALVAGAAWWFGLLPGGLVGVAAASGLLGALSESALNRILPRWGVRLDHEFANALNTFVGAAAALRIARVVVP
jgi:uncharacterized protein (TIGR00297 family)